MQPTACVTISDITSTEPGDAPTNFTSTIIKYSTAIKLKWNEPRQPNGVLVSYTITYNTPEDFVSRTEALESVAVGGLEENTWYRFDIVASTRIGSGPSASLTTRTDISGLVEKYHECCVTLILT